MLKIGYGKADFAEIRTKGYFYQDRTQFIEILEEKGTHYPAFLRPRRFGKSLFISMLHHQQFYYIDSEEEQERHYIDIYLEAMRGYKPKYEIAFELKYLKKKDTQDVNVLEVAEVQLKKYLVLKKYINRKNLRGFAVIVKNDEIFWKEIRIV